MNTLVTHQYCGSLRTSGESVISTMLTAYAVDWPYSAAPKLLFASFVGTQEVVKAVKSALWMGETVSVTAERHIAIEAEKKGYKVIATTAVARVQMHNMMLVSNAVNSDELVDGIAYVTSSQNITRTQLVEEVMARLYRYFTTPMYPEWRDYVFTRAMEKKLLNLVTYQKGINIWRAAMNDDWQQIVSDGIKNGSLMGLSEIAQRREVA